MSYVSGSSPTSWGHSRKPEALPNTAFDRSALAGPCTASEPGGAGISHPDSVTIVDTAGGEISFFFGSKGTFKTLADAEDTALNRDCSGCSQGGFVLSASSNYVNWVPVNGGADSGSIVGRPLQISPLAYSGSAASKVAFNYGGR